MKRRNLRSSLVVVAFLAVASVLSLASAQIDDRARALLEGIQPASVQEIDTLDQTMVITSYMPDGTTQEMSSRTVIDYVNRRLASFMEIAPGMSTRTIYQDGKVTMTMPGMPMALPVPPGVAESLAETFEKPPAVFLKDTDKATYDGPVDYGVLKGELVTYTTTMPGSSEPVTMGYVFDGGKLVGTRMEADGTEMVSVFDSPISQFTSSAFDNTTYMLQDGTWTKASHVHFEDSIINEPIDESVFE